MKHYNINFKMENIANEKLMTESNLRYHNRFERNKYVILYDYFDVIKATVITYTSDMKI